MKRKEKTLYRLKDNKKQVLTRYKLAIDVALKFLKIVGEGKARNR